MAQTQTQRRASLAVAAWLSRQEHNAAWLVRRTGSDPGTIGDFLNGLRWPKFKTQGRIEKAIGWPDGTLTEIADGGEPPEPGAAVGGGLQDAGYVASPGERVEGGASHDEVLEGIREMRDDLRALREAIERLADARQPGA